MQYDGSWYRGRPVELIKGSMVYGVAFEDGDWAQEVRLGDTDVRYISAGDGREVRSGRKRKREEGPAASGVDAEDRPFKCSTCGKAFTTSGNLAVHMRVHIAANRAVE